MLSEIHRPVVVKELKDRYSNRKQFLEVKVFLKKGESNILLCVQLPDECH